MDGKKVKRGGVILLLVGIAGIVISCLGLNTAIDLLNDITTPAQDEAFRGMAISFLIGIVIGGVVSVEGLLFIKGGKPD